MKTRRTKLQAQSAHVNEGQTRHNRVLLVHSDAENTRQRVGVLTDRHERVFLDLRNTRELRTVTRAHKLPQDELHEELRPADKQHVARAAELARVKVGVSVLGSPVLDERHGHTEAPRYGCVAGRLCCEADLRAELLVVALGSVHWVCMAESAERVQRVATSTKRENQSAL